MTESMYAETDGIDSETKQRLQTIVANHPNAGVMRCLALATPHTQKYTARTIREVIENIKGISFDTERETDETDTEDYYRRVRPVYEELATLDGFATLGINDLWGWYTRKLGNHPGYEWIGRPSTLLDDQLYERLERTIYSVTSYKDRLPVQDYDPGKKTEWRNGDDPMPEYGDIRAFAVFGDIDLCDDLNRGELDAETRETVEQTLAAYADEYAELIGNPEAVYGLDSVGGAYLFTAPEATLPIAEHFEDRETRGEVLDELNDRSNEWLAEAEQRVNDRIEGAADVIDPDWVNNKNRQYKAPLSIHGDHDAVVTPLDPLNYDLTPLSAVDDELIEEATAWCESFTAVEHTDCVDSLVANLWPEYDGDWKDTLETWLEDENKTVSKKSPSISENKRERKSREEIERLETTHDINDIYDALEVTTKDDLSSNFPSPVRREDGVEIYDPEDFKYRDSSSNESLIRERPGEWWDQEYYNDHPLSVWDLWCCLKDYKDDSYFGRNPSQKLEGEEFWKAVDEFRADGAPVPVLTDGLPAPEDINFPERPEPSGFTETNGRLECDHCETIFVSPAGLREHDCDIEIPLTNPEVANRTRRAEKRALENGFNRIIQSPPSGGKSSELAAAIAETDTPTTVLVGRGRKEGYGQYKDWAEENSLNPRILPSFHHDCPTANGDNGEWWEDQVEGVYRNLNISGPTIHENATELFDRPLPCQPDCPYGYGFEHEDIDLLIGHPSHAHIIDTVAPGRAVVFDEYPDGVFELTPRDWGDGEFKPGVQRQREAVNAYLEYAELTYQNFDELIAATDPPELPDRDVGFAVTSRYPADTPAVVQTLTAHDDSYTYRGDSFIGWYDPESGGVWLLQPPELDYASAVVGLDATPTPEMWELTLGEEFTHTRVLNSDERDEYLSYVLRNRFIEITGGTRPVGRAENIYETSAYAQFDAIPGECPIITSKTAKKTLDESMTDHWFPDELHFYSVKSSNKIYDETMAIIYGCPSRGDRYIQRWCAYADEEYQEPDREDDDGNPLWSNMGTGLDYGDLGNKILQNVREKQVFQAAMRAGRTPEESYIYIITEAIPEWLPRVRTKPVPAYSKGEVQVLSTLSNQWKLAAEIIDSVDIKKRRVHEILSDRDDIESRSDPMDGRRTQYKRGND